MAYRYRLVLSTLGLAVAVVLAQVPTPGQSDPTAVCDFALNDQIQQCRMQVWSNEANLPNGACWSSDYPCICNVQQGLLDCYSPCPGSTPQTDIDYNNANCNGQHGVTNAQAAPGGLQYSALTPLTTTGSGATVATTTSALITSETPVTTSSTTAITPANGDTTVTLSSDVTETAASSSSVYTGYKPPAANSQPTTQESTPTPAQSVAPNVFNGSAGKKIQLNGGGISAGLLLGMISIIVLVRA